VPAELTRSVDDTLDVRDLEIIATTRAMASSVTIRAGRRRHNAKHAPMSLERLSAATLETATVFHDVERACTRFDPSSPLGLANAAPRQWHVVPDVLYQALSEAHAAHRRTGGRFDPRVLETLLALGYGTSLPFEEGSVATPASTTSSRHGPLPPWRLRLRPKHRGVHLGGHPVDLGGIGKGLAVRWARQRLAPATPNFLVEAGGDCFCAGVAPEGVPWRVGVEDPRGGTSPVAVLEVTDRAVATSSTRLRHWRSGGQRVHHLIDPATSRPGGEGLLAVTVVARDPAWAEVWSKVLFLEGSRGVAAAARHHRIDALWVHDDGEVSVSDSLGTALIWRST
jgi:FAD:protein FMN transferase